MCSYFAEASMNGWIRPTSIVVALKPRAIVATLAISVFVSSATSGAVSA